METLELVKRLADLAPAALYLAGVIYLYRRNEAQTTRHEAKFEALLDRYHNQVVETTKAYQIILEQLKDLK